MEKYGALGEGSFCLDEEAGVNALLNDAMEFLQYARGLTGLLVETLQDDDVLDRRRLPLALGGDRCIHRHGRSMRVTSTSQDGVGSGLRAVVIAL